MLASVHLPFSKRISHRYWNVNRFSSNFAQISQKNLVNYAYYSQFQFPEEVHRMMDASKVCDGDSSRCYWDSRAVGKSVGRMVGYVLG